MASKLNIFPVKAAVSIVVILANFLYVLQLAFPALLSTSPLENGAEIDRNSIKNEEPALCRYFSKQDRLFRELSVMIG